MIVITTPTGLIGHQVLERVLEADEPVRVIVRDPSRLSPQTRERVEVIEGSHGDPEVVDRAFVGADSLFWLAPPNRTAPTLDAVFAGFARPAAEAIVRHRLKRVVDVSALGRGVTEHAGLVSGSLAMDDLFTSTGAGFRALVMPSFMDNVLRHADAITRQGMFFSTVSPDRKLPTCATRDIAAVAADLLLDHSWSGQGTLAVLGPEDLSHNEMAEIISDVLGKPVSYRQVPIDAFRQQLSGAGMSEAMADAMIEMMIAKDQGLDNAEPRTPASTTPTSFRQWCEDVLRPAVAA
jgi:uncharacterized protein YbjT (DUF2867 family)